MKFIIQRVSDAKVIVDHNLIGTINKGLLVFVGISDIDNEYIADKMIEKLIGLRIFEDEKGKTNLDIKSVNGELLIVSQFTLYADCKKGNRPSFFNAGNPYIANQLYQYMIEKCTSEIEYVQHGCFGADMKIQLTNDGPFTIILDSNELGY